MSGSGALEGGYPTCHMGDDEAGLGLHFEKHARSSHRRWLNVKKPPDSEGTRHILRRWGPYSGFIYFIYYWIALRRKSA